jgi:Flp pilus assembly protein TadG
MILPYLTVLMPVLLGFVGLGTEAGLWFYSHQTLQSAADSAAVSTAIGLGQTSQDTQAQAITARYGFVNGTNGVSVTVNNPPESGNFTTNANAVEVIVRHPQARMFSALAGSGAVTIKGRAVAVKSGGQMCLLALDQTVSGAVSASGGASINMPQCGIFSNSNSPSSISLNGGANITALSAGAAGGLSQTGGSSLTTTPTPGNITLNAPRMSDPYANVPLPSRSGCNPCTYNGGTQTINPGVYPGGISISGSAQVTMNPGIYFMDGGSLTVSGGATLTGNSVTIVFTGTGSSYASASFSGGSRVNLTAPTTGQTAGMVFFGDPNMPTSTTFSLSGGNTFNFSGSLYLPRANVSISGGAGAGAVLVNRSSPTGSLWREVEASGTAVSALASGRSACRPDWWNEQRCPGKLASGRKRRLRCDGLPTASASQRKGLRWSSSAYLRRYSSPWSSARWIWASAYIARCRCSMPPRLAPNTLSRMAGMAWMLRRSPRR